MKEARPLPSLEQLNKLFTYDKETGTLTWKEGRKVGKQAGHVDETGYRRVQTEGVSYKAHRIAYYMGTGVEPNHIDHINGVKDDNRLDNLRSVSQADNTRNACRSIANTSGVTGVCFIEQMGKWRARLSQKHLGYFPDKIDAIYARHYAQVDANYHTNHGR